MVSETANHALVLRLAILPCLGILAGALAAEALRISRKALGSALHFAEGAMLAVVGVELMPRALGIEPPWILVAAFVLGGGAFILIERAVEGFQRIRGGSRGPWMIYIGALVDYLTDGIMIGAGAAIAPHLGLVLALGQAVANAPLAFVSMATLKKGVGRRARGLLTVIFLGVLTGGAALGYGLLRTVPEVFQLAVLAFGSGVLVLVIVEEITPHADLHADRRQSAFSVLAGFGMFSLFSLYL